MKKFLIALAMMVAGEAVAQNVQIFGDYTKRNRWNYAVPDSVNLVWEHPSGAYHGAPVLVSNGRVFTVYHNGYCCPPTLQSALVCISLTTGKMLWNLDRSAFHPNTLYASPIGVFGNRLYVVPVQKSSFPANDEWVVPVYCIDVTNGTVLWTSAPSVSGLADQVSGVTQTALIDEAGDVYVAAGPTNDFDFPITIEGIRTTKINGTTGETLWMFENTFTFLPATDAMGQILVYPASIYTWTMSLNEFAIGGRNPLNWWRMESVTWTGDSNFTRGMYDPTLNRMLLVENGGFGQGPGWWNLTQFSFDDAPSGSEWHLQGVDAWGYYTDFISSGAHNMSFNNEVMFVTAETNHLAWRVYPGGWMTETSLVLPVPGVVQAKVGIIHGLDNTLVYYTQRYPSLEEGIPDHVVGIRKTGNSAAIMWQVEVGGYGSARDAFPTICQDGVVVNAGGKIRLYGPRTPVSGDRRPPRLPQNMIPN